MWNRVPFRSYIIKSLWTGGLLLVVLLVSAALWGLLTALGDNAGGQGAKAVLLVTLICWTINFITLVVLLALAYITSTPEGEE